ncbi:hypothetical protein CCAX7_32630 [Capsulimonas corticalis]|uniref:Uncharacterized protein n=1 Tax=Capsulimonas corticalis TaxID=2219043 RepID=A0A402D3Z6_9BACT|nr:RICIN domain-containing protein [Capsulimonas corticalis]BDI31212.1 hypothetical protein CCAX7_32630 [Capsulimonas corticalis]
MIAFAKHWKKLAAPAALISFGLALTPIPSAFAAADPNITTAAQNELNYIASIRNQGLTLSSQTVANPWFPDNLDPNPPNDKMSEITRVNQMTGKFPAIIGEDFLNCDAYPDHGAAIIRLAKNYAARGGLVQFQFHEGSPRSWAPEGSSFYVGGSNPAPLSGGEWSDLLYNPGSAIHQNWQHHMDLVAGWLGQLRDANIPVLWRPYHEADGNWFWWGGNAGNYQALWRMQYSYLTGTKGLHNLIWVTSSPTSGFYPGANFVDISGMDIYSSNTTDGSYTSSNNSVRADAPGAPTVLSECGTLPDTNYIHQLNYAYVDVWGGPYLDPNYYSTGGAAGAYNSLQQVQNFYNDGRTVNLDRVAIPTAFLSPNTWYKIVNNHSVKVLGVAGASGALGANAVQYADNGTPDHNWRFDLLPNGGYHIVNQNSGLLLAVNGASGAQGAQVTQWSDNGTADHNWDLVSQGNGRYHIVNQNSGLALGIAGASTSDSANAVQWGDNGGDDHNWAIVPVSSPIASGHRYHIVNAHSGLFLDNPNGTNVAGTYLQQFVNTYSPAQEWVLNNVGGDLWTAVNYAGGLALDDYGWSNTAGTQIDEWSFNGAAVQQWHVVALGDGTYQIKSAVSNLPMEIQGASIANGGAVGQWTDNGNACQHWTFQFVQ